MSLHTLYHIHEKGNIDLAYGYIRITDNAPRRKKEHFSKLKEGMMHRNQKLQLAYYKHTLKFDVIKQSENRVYIASEERRLRPKPNMAWNVKSGGEGENGTLSKAYTSRASLSGRSARYARNAEEAKAILLHSSEFKKIENRTRSLNPRPQNTGVGADQRIKDMYSTLDLTNSLSEEVSPKGSRFNGGTFSHQCSYSTSITSKHNKKNVPKAHLTKLTTRKEVRVAMHNLGVPATLDKMPPMSGAMKDYFFDILLKQKTPPSQGCKNSGKDKATTTTKRYARNAKEAKAMLRGSSYSANTEPSSPKRGMLSCESHYSAKRFAQNVEEVASKGRRFDRGTLSHQSSCYA